MTLDELSRSLPNGFHDAELKTLSLDFIGRQARLGLEIWIAAYPEVPGELEAYRPAEVRLSGLYYWLAEPPDDSYPHWWEGGGRLDVGLLHVLKHQPAIRLPETPVGAFVNWIFFNSWNAFAYVAAETAELEWVGDKFIRE